MNKREILFDSSASHEKILANAEADDKANIERLYYLSDR